MFSLSSPFLSVLRPSPSDRHGPEAKIKESPAFVWGGASADLESADTETDSAETVADLVR